LPWLNVAKILCDDVVSLWAKGTVIFPVFDAEGFLRWVITCQKRSSQSQGKSIAHRFGAVTSGNECQTHINMKPKFQNEPTDRLQRASQSVAALRRRLSRFFLALAALALTSGVARAGVAYGTINNFDTVNDTGVECHGFEIEIEDLHSADITYTYSWNHYGTPRITEDNSNPLRPRVRIRYESAKNADGTWAAYTAIPAGPILPTDGHQFTNPNTNFGGEHFGAGYRGSPTNVTYHWLIDDGTGALVLGPAVNVATPVFTYFPPGAGAPAQVAAVIAPPDAPHVREFGPASWVKGIITTSHNNREVKLRNLVSDDPHDPDDKNWRNGEPDEVETEWQLLQTEFNAGNGNHNRNGHMAGAPEDLDNGDEIITRRYEFYKYVGPIDPETGEAQSDSVGADGIHGIAEYADTVVVGDFFGSQMSAFDNEQPVGLIDHLPDGEINVPYAARTMVIAAVPFTAKTTGELPDGMSFNAANGELSGTPTGSGIFTFDVRVTATNNPVQMKTYTFAIAAAGEALPPHSTVDTRASPLDRGTTTGSGFYTNNTTATVTATPAAGFAFANWTDNGEVVSQSASYTFTNVLNRSLVANFVALPLLSFSQLPSGELAFTWPTNDTGLVLQQNANLDSPNWMAVTNAVTVAGTNNRVAISPLTGNHFFRLVRP
jgi:hypothetical protein